MFSVPQYTSTELQQYDYFVMQDPVFEEKIEEPVFTHVYEENGVLYCASSTSKGVYWYTYVLNNPLTLTDPSGYLSTYGEYLKSQNNYAGGYFYYRGDFYSKSDDRPGFDIYGGIGGGCIGYTGGATYYDNATGQAFVNGEPVSPSDLNTYFINNIADPSNYTTYVWGQTGSSTGDLPNGELYVKPVYGWTVFESSSNSGNTQSLIPTSDIAWGINGAGWLWGVTATLNATDFNIDAASRAAGKLATKVGVGINIAGTAAEGYDLIQNWEHAGRGDVAKFGLDAAITTTTTILYLTGVGAPVAIVLTGVQIANTLGAFDFFYEKINTPINGAGGSW